MWATYTSRLYLTLIKKLNKRTAQTNPQRYYLKVQSAFIVLKNIFFILTITVFK